MSKSLFTPPSSPFFTPLPSPSRLSKPGSPSHETASTLTDHRNRLVPLPISPISTSPPRATITSSPPSPGLASTSNPPSSFLAISPLPNEFIYMVMRQAPMKDVVALSMINKTAYRLSIPIIYDTVVFPTAVDYTGKECLRWNSLKGKDLTDGTVLDTIAASSEGYYSSASRVLRLGVAFTHTRKIIIRGEVTADLRQMMGVMEGCRIFGRTRHLVIEAEGVLKMGDSLLDQKKRQPLRALEFFKPSTLTDVCVTIPHQEVGTMVHGRYCQFVEDWRENAGDYFPAGCTVVFHDIADQLVPFAIPSVVNKMSFSVTASPPSITPYDQTELLLQITSMFRSLRKVGNEEHDYTIVRLHGTAEGWWDASQPELARKLWEASLEREIKSLGVEIPVREEGRAFADRVSVVKHGEDQEHCAVCQCTWFLLASGHMNAYGVAIVRL